MSRRLDTAGQAIVLWGVGGVLLLLAKAIVGLGGMVRGAFDHELGPLHLGVAALWIAFMAYTEGYRGFQQRFSPRVVRRAVHLAQAPRPWLVLLAPAYAMGLVHATRRRLVASWALLAAIVALVLLVRTLDQPWRGIVDMGVVVGLGWGCASLLALLLPALAGRTPEVDPDLPERPVAR